MIELSKKVLNLKIVRYLMTAATATMVDVTVFYITCNLILHNQDFQILGLFHVKASTISLLVSFTCGLITNFTLTKIFVFSNSDLRTRHQFMRYTAVAVAFLFLNYLMMDYVIDHFDIFYKHRTLARGFAAVTIGVLSFITHKFFSFRVKNSDEVEDGI